MPERTKNNPEFLPIFKPATSEKTPGSLTSSLACSPIATRAECSETGDIIHRAEDMLINKASSDFELSDSDDNDAVSKCVVNADCNVQLKLVLKPSLL